MSKECSKASVIAQRLVNGYLRENKTFSNSSSTGEIATKTAEYLLAYQDYAEKKAKDHLPFESLPYTYYFKYAEIFSCVKKGVFVSANLKKGGTIKIYHTLHKNLIHNDDGIIALTNTKKIICTNYVVNNYKISPKKEYWEIEGKLVEMNNDTWKVNKSNKSFIKYKLSTLLNRLYQINEAPVYFKRRFEIDSSQITITDSFKLLDNKIRIEKIYNHIPFSYKSSFIAKLLEDKNSYLSKEQIEELNAKREFTKKIFVDL